MTENVKHELEGLLARYITKYKNIYGELPTVDFNPPWPSACIVTVGPDNPEKQFWQPVERNEFGIFDTLEQGLDFSFPSAIKSYYGNFWSNGLCVDFEDDSFSLIQLWNEEDEDNLRHNMLGHCYARLKGRLPLSYFIGSMENDVLSLCHESGKVLLERPGKKPHREVAADLSTFLKGCAPNLKNYD
jgi:SecY interacting protein Syd